jgi:hypothetical protein
MDGATPLFIASQNGHVELVRTLVDLGAAVDQAKVGVVGMCLVVGANDWVLFVRFDAAGGCDARYEALYAVRW